MKPNYNRNEYEKVVKFVAKNNPYSSVKGRSNLIRSRLDACIKNLLEDGKEKCLSVSSCGFRILWTEDSSPFKLKIEEVLTEGGYIK